MLSWYPRELRIPAYPFIIFLAALVQHNSLDTGDIVQRKENAIDDDVTWPIKIEYSRIEILLH